MSLELGERQMDEYLPLAFLNAWEYCPRRFYLEYVLGELLDNEHIILGRHLHRHIDEVKTRQEGEITIHQQQWVWSDRLGVKGIIDAVEERPEGQVPLEYKKGRMAKHLNDFFSALCSGVVFGRTNWGGRSPLGRFSTTGIVAVNGWSLPRS